MTYVSYTMGFGTLYVRTDGNVDVVKSQIEKLKKKHKTAESKKIIAVRKVIDDTGSKKQLVTILAPEDKAKANIMVEFDYDKNTNLANLQQQISGIAGVHIIKSIASR